MYNYLVDNIGLLVFGWEDGLVEGFGGFIY